MMIRRRTSRNRGEGGYMLLAILFMLFLLILAASIAVPSISHEIKREREIEMIHRGEQYARAIKKYYKKFNRYPTRIEELENTNNLRFLRKRYKDPMSADAKFRLLYYGDLRIAQNAGRGSSGSGASGSQDSPPPTSAFGQSGQQQQQQGSQSSFGSGQSGTLGGAQPGLGSSQSGFGSSQSGSQLGSSSQQQGGLGGQVFGGGPIVGVASSLEKDGIHEFNNKKRYDQWMFIYDPQQDRGGLIKGPYQPQQGTGMGGSGVPGINAPGTMPGAPSPGTPQQPQQIPQPLQNPVQQ
jgi:type II secretory pathway pseudopilin PulG